VRENGWVRLPVGHPLLTKSGGRADVILVGTHNTRVRMTEMVRRQKGLSAMALPRAGEPLMACANYRSLELFNKTEARLVADGEAVSGNPEAWRGVISYFPGDRERRESVMLHRNGLFQAQAHKSPEWSGSAEADRRLRVWFGYACTVHSAQGSEFDHVGLVNEAHMFREFASRHLYTAASRARETLWVMQP
jgi:exodeoxyribonuclease-5